MRDRLGGSATPQVLDIVVVKIDFKQKKTKKKYFKFLPQQLGSTPRTKIRKGCKGGSENTENDQPNFRHMFIVRSMLFCGFNAVRGRGWDYVYNCSDVWSNQYGLV